MLITCEFPHDQYGTLILSGQYNEAEPECNVHAHAVLESVLTYDDKELLQYHKGVPNLFTRSEFQEMEEHLQFNGEPRTLVKPTAETLAFVRNSVVNTYISSKELALQEREMCAAIEQGKRRQMQPFNVKDEPPFEVEAPWDGRDEK